jgi:hypothetical protein
MVTPGHQGTHCPGNNLVAKADTHNPHPLVQQGLAHILNQRGDPLVVIKRVVFRSRDEDCVNLV